MTEDEFFELTMEGLLLWWLGLPRVLAWAFLVALITVSMIGTGVLLAAIMSIIRS